MIVAPNSPRLRANESSVPVMMPGNASGTVIVASTRSRPAPSVRAAASSFSSTASSESRIARTMSGKPMTAHAIAAPVQRKAENDAEMFIQESADGAPPAEQEQQEITDYHRRQHEREMHDRVEDALAWKRPRAST